MSGPVVVFGDLVVDHILQIERLPVEAGQHQTIRQMEISPGGAANVLIAGARLGLAMQAVGPVGDDDAGEHLMAALRSEGVNVEHVIPQAGERTSTVVTLVGQAGQHVFLGYRGARGPEKLTPGWEEAIRQGAALFLDGWTYRAMPPSVTLEAARTAFEAGVPLFFDPGPEFPCFAPEWLDGVLACTAVLLLTEEEARGMLSEALPAEGLAARLLARGPRLVVIKRGAGGCLIGSADRTATHPGFPVEVRDATGAGDTLAAAVMFACLRGYDPEAMCVLANAAGAAAVRKLGAGLNVPHADEIRAILRQAGVQNPHLRAFLESGAG